MVLACALMFALHIVSVAHFAPRHDTIRLTTVQIATVAVLSGGAAFVPRDAARGFARRNLGAIASPDWWRRRGSACSVCAALHHADAHRAFQPEPVRRVLRLVVGQ